MTLGVFGMCGTLYNERSNLSSHQYYMGFKCPSHPPYRKAEQYKTKSKKKKKKAEKKNRKKYNMIAHACGVNTPT